MTTLYSLYKPSTPVADTYMSPKTSVKVKTGLEYYCIMWCYEV